MRPGVVKFARVPALVAGAVGVAMAATLTGCVPTVPLSPADDAKNAGCADVVVRLPDRVAGLEKRTTDAQGTGAWGDPAAVILRCGVPVPAPTSTLTCYTVSGIDWLIDPQEADPQDADQKPDSAARITYIFTTYGRDPATEVIVDDELASGQAALSDLAIAVGSIPADRGCVSPQDTLAD